MERSLELEILAVRPDPERVSQYIRFSPTVLAQHSLKVLQMVKDGESSWDHYLTVRFAHHLRSEI